MECSSKPYLWYFTAIRKLLPTTGKMYTNMYTTSGNFKMQAIFNTHNRQKNLHTKTKLITILISLSNDSYKVTENVTIATAALLQ